MAGVRRAVAVRELGGRIIPARLQAGGNRGPVFYVRLNELYSSKDRVSRSAQNGRYAGIERWLSTPAGRLKMRPLVVEALTAKQAAAFTPLMAVVLEP
jgi:hypothetical protein